MSTQPREWPNNYGNLRDNIAVLIHRNNVLVRSVHINKLSDEEEEALEEVEKNNEAILRAITAAGAAFDPLVEVENIASGLKASIPAFV